MANKVIRMSNGSDNLYPIAGKLPTRVTVLHERKAIPTTDVWTKGDATFTLTDVALVQVLYLWNAAAPKGVAIVDSSRDSVMYAAYINELYLQNGSNNGVCVLAAGTYNAWYKTTAGTGNDCLVCLISYLRS